MYQQSTDSIASNGHVAPLANASEVDPELTFVKERDDPIVVAANMAFHRIENHRKLFRSDWLPFLTGVYHLSLQAWETAGRRTTLDGKPDWTHDRVQVAFRQAIGDLPWANYFEKRRALLSALRSIGGDSERFLAWFDDPSKEEMRERVGYPETLWRKYAAEMLKPAVHDDDEVGDGDDEAEARTDAERMDDLVTENETCRDFCLRLRTSVNDGRSTLETGLREDLDRLLDAEDAS